MDAFRYGLALVFACILAPLLLYWPLLHGFVGFWRRLGPRRTFAVLWTGFVLAAVALFQARDHLLRVDFGTSWPLASAGALGLGVATWLRVLLHRDITSRVLLGLPEIAPDRTPGALVRTGLYARVRHPRYLQFLLAQLGWAMIANYLAPYVVWALWIVAVYVIVVLEERELRDRFGEDYERYRREVPRFVPRLRRRGGLAPAGRSGGA